MILPTLSSSSPVRCCFHFVQACGCADKCSDAHGLDTIAVEVFVCVHVCVYVCVCVCVCVFVW